jgi:hypothetical protein
MQLVLEECHALGAPDRDVILKFSVICADCLERGGGNLVNLYIGHCMAIFNMMAGLEIKFGRQVEQNFKVPKERLFR